VGVVGASVAPVAAAVGAIAALAAHCSIVVERRDDGGEVTGSRGDDGLGLGRGNANGSPREHLFTQRPKGRAASP
jgi:hypothetical protein